MMILLKKMRFMSKKFQCPLCDKVYIAKNALYTHIETNHPEQLKNNISAAQLYFNYRNHYELSKGNGKCIIDGRPTKFNDKTERYERLCDNPKCKEAYRKMFQERMKKRYGTDNLLNDPNQQKKMLENRKISGVYIWSDGKTKTKYTGSYEKDFLEFIDLVMKWENPNDIMMPAPQIIDYKYDGKIHFYIPDVYITSLNLIIEIKSKENKHYRLRDLDIEKAKDKKIEELDFNYIKIYDKKYAIFFNWLLEYRDKLNNSDSTKLIILEDNNPFKNL